MIPKAVMRRALVWHLLLCLMRHTLASTKQKNQTYFDQALFRPWLDKNKKATAHLKEKNTLLRFLKFELLSKQD